MMASLVGQMVKICPLPVLYKVVCVYQLQFSLSSPSLPGNYNLLVSASVTLFLFFKFICIIFFRFHM